jgi:GMP synthase-like glutamine amidotransferase
MFYWLDKLSEQISQYDEIDNIKIFFMELPLMNTEKLNYILQKNKYKYSFEYFSNETINNNYLDNESLNILKQLNLKQISLHIKSTEEFLKTNKGDLYIILACKIPGEEEKGFFHFPSLFKGIYRRNKEDWRYLLASKNEFPDVKMLKKAKCIIIPGSELSVHDNLKFLRQTEKYFYNLIKDIEEKGKYPQLKILGICFGLEIIMNGFGAKLNKSKWGNESRYGPEIINLKDEFWELNYVKKSGVKKRKFLIIAEAHSEQIIKYPPKSENFFKTIGSSDACECEVSIDRKEKILMLQGHPEYSPGLSIASSIDELMEFSGIKEEDINEESMNKFEEEYMNKEENKNSNFDEWRSICDSFMRS